MSTRMVGLDIGTSSIKATQVRRAKDGSITVEKVAMLDLPAGGLVREGVVYVETTDTLATLGWMDRIRARLGVRYPFE